MARARKLSDTALAKRVEEALGPFHETLDFAGELRQSRRHPQDALILLCSRLDALGNWLDRWPTNRESFVEFVCLYGGHEELMRGVSLGNLYQDLRYYEWLTPGGLVEAPGRLCRFSPADTPIIRFLDESEIPLTEKAIQGLFRRMSRTVMKRFRASPRQPKGKREVAPLGEVKRVLGDGFDTPRWRRVRAPILQASGPLLKTYTLADILYREFRCQSIHGLAAIDAKRFFSEARPYWRVWHAIHGYEFLLVEFPAAFIEELLRNALERVRSEVLAKRLLPPEIHNRVFPGEGLDWLDYLDVDALPDIQRVRLALRDRG
jgi:hypothetical protein